MTDKLRDAAQQALDVLEELQGGCTDSDDGTVEVITVWCPEVVEALRAALAQQDAQVVPPRVFVVVARRRQPSGRYSHTIESDMPLPIGALLHAEPRNTAPRPPAQQDAQCGLCGADRPFTGSCGGGRENPRALCFAARVPLAQQDAQAVAQDDVRQWNDGFRAAMNSAASGVRELYINHCFHHGVDGLLERCKRLEQSFICHADSALNAAPTPPAKQDAKVVAQGFDWSKFPGHLIDHYEGEVLTEELLQRAAADLCAAPMPPAQGMPAVCQGTNCGAADGQDHSPECIAETAEAQGWGDAPEAVAARQSLNASPTPPAQQDAQAVPVVWMGKMDFETLKSRGRVTATLYGEPVGNKTNEVGLCLATPTPPCRRNNHD